MDYHTFQKKDFDTLYKNRPYVFEIEKDWFESNNEIIIKILEKENFGKYKSISFLNANYNYDIYKIELEDKTICIKYTLDEEDFLLKQEFDTIKKINSSFVPIPYSYNFIKFGDTIHYSIYEYINTENTKNFGTACLFEYSENFAKSFFNLQKTESPQKNHINYLDFITKNCNLDFLEKENIEAINEYSNYEQFKKIIDSLKFEIQKTSNIESFKGDFFCHGNLKPSNILFFNKEFKFIDFENAFRGNVFFDISHLSIHLGIGEDLEKKILIEFLKCLNQEFTIQHWASYRKCHAINLRKLLAECILSFLKEVYVFSSSRPIKIFEIVQFFILNKNLFLTIPTVQNNKDFLFKTFYDPLIGIDDNKKEQV